MKVILNTTNEPLRIPLGAGRVLHLGPGQTGNVADEAPKTPAIARMIKARKLKLVGGEASVGAGSVAQTRRGSGQGHSQPSHVFPRGNRG